MGVFLIYILLLNLSLYKITYLKLNNNKNLFIIITISLILNIIYVLLFDVIVFNIFFCLFISISCFIFYIDFKYQLIFDEYNLLLFLFGIIYIISYSNYIRLVEFIIMFLIVVAIVFFMKILNKEFIGGGDLKLFIVMSLFLGLKGSYLSITIGSMIAVIYYLFRKNKIIPFGPFLCMGYILVFFAFNMHIN